MVGSMYAGIAGLKAHMEKLNVIGNNVANVNTYGFKAGHVSFQESLYTTLQASTAGTDAMGGINASQIGYGSKIGTIDLNMTPGNYSPSSIATHCMIDGDGYFLVGEKSDNPIQDPSVLKLTRVGSFTVDDDGYLVDANGNVAYGFLPSGSDTDFSYTDKVDNNLVPIRMPLRRKEATTGTPVIPAGSAVYSKFPGTAGGMGESPDGNGGVSDGEIVKYGTVSLDTNGMLTAMNQDTKETMVIGYLALASVDNPNGLVKSQGPYYTAMGNAGRVKVGSANGVLKGNLNNAAVDDANAESLVKLSKLFTSALELANTDLSTEFSEMITTQRGFQANTKIITVTDQMLEELVNMKR